MLCVEDTYFKTQYISQAVEGLFLKFSAAFFFVKNS